MKIDAKEFLSAFELVDCVPVTSAVASSRYVRIIGAVGKAKVQLTGLARAEARIKCEGDLDFLVERRALGPFLKEADGVVSCEVSKGGGWILRSGGKRLSVTKPEEIPPSVELAAAGRKVPIDPKLIGMLAYYAKGSGNNAYLEQVYLKKDIGAIATDSFSVVAVLEKGGETFSIPCFTATLVGKLSAKEVSVSKEGTTIITEAGKIFQPLMVGDKPYPVEKIEALLGSATKQPEILSFKPAELIQEFKYLANYAWAGAPNVNGLPDTAHGVLRLTLDANTMKAESSVKVKYGKAKAPEKLTLVPERMLPWLSYVGSICGKDATVAFGVLEQLSFLRFKEAGATHLLLLADVG